MTLDFVGARVLVTGGTGFIGRQLCSALAKSSARILAISRRNRPPQLSPSLFRSVDLLDSDAVQAAVRQFAPTHVVHLAALKLDGGLLDNLRPSYDANLLSTLNLAVAVIATGGCHRFVYLSSAEEYGRATVPFDARSREVPLTAYGLSKLAATQLLQALSVMHDLPIAVLRATSVYGPGQSPRMFVPSLLHALMNGTEFPMTSGNQTRDFIYVGDVVDGILRALAMPDRHDGALHLSAGAPVTVREVALLVARLIGGASEALVKFGAVPYRDGEAMDYWASNTEAKVVLGWSPRVSLEEGIRLSIEHLRSTIATK